MTTTNIADTDLPKVPPDAFKVLADYSGYVSGYTLNNVIPQAEKFDLCIRYHPNIEFVAGGTLLAYVWNANTYNQKRSKKKKKHREGSLKTRILLHKSSKNMTMSSSHNSTSSSNNVNVDVDPTSDEEAVKRQRRRQSLAEDREAEELLGVLVSSGISISTIRSGQYDVLLGVQTLTDVAVKALSAAVNDPMTAIQALDYLSILFGRLAHLSFDISCSRDSKGILRVAAPRRSFAYMLTQKTQSSKISYETIKIQSFFFIQ